MKSITGHKNLKRPKIGNLKKKNRNHKKVPKQDEDTGNLQILLHFNPSSPKSLYIGFIIPDRSLL